MSILSRRGFFGASVAPLFVVRYDKDGKKFRLVEWKEEKTGKRFTSALRLDGKWVDGPVPEKAEWFEKFPAGYSHEGECGFLVTCKTLRFSEVKEKHVIDAFMLLDGDCNQVSYREMKVELGGNWVQDYTLSTTYTLACGKLNASPLGTYGTQLLREKLQEGGLL